MKALAPALLVLGLSACSLGDEGPPSASKEQVEAMLTICHVRYRLIEPQPEGGGRWVVSLAVNEPERAAKSRCLIDEQKRFGADFTMFGFVG